jgi:outer membrane lipoprotein-sorting protein
LIYVAGATYTKSGGKWSPGLTSLQEMKELEQKNRQNNKVTCRYLRDELVNGEMAALYSVHEETPKNGKSDSQVWISKAKGLLLRSEIDLGDKMHVSTRVEYGNVKAPM